MDLKRYKHEGAERTDWAVIGERGAVHFWKFNHHPRLGGVEEHRKEPADYQRGDRPSHDVCFLLDGPCWHDGSSLYADTFFPILENQGEEEIYIKLADEYRARFERQ